MNIHRVLLQSTAQEDGVCIDIKWNYQGEDLIITNMSIYYIIESILGENVADTVDSASYLLLLQTAIDEIKYINN